MSTGKKFKIFSTLWILIIVYCEYLVYYVVISKCHWPVLSAVKEQHNGTNTDNILKAMILADIHLLGPFRGHWLDKIYREWHMHRAFQTTITLFKPETIFMLGDLFDEGYFVDQLQFRKYIVRFHQLFHTPNDIKIISAVGNHDVGFHYRLDPYFTDRFENEFNNIGVNLYTIKNIHFVVINSMAMENDDCYFCDRAQEELTKVKSYFSKKKFSDITYDFTFAESLNCLKHPNSCEHLAKTNITYSRPILMQHFPTYRISDIMCNVHDAPKIERFKENHDVLSKESTEVLGKNLFPRLAFGGHSHHYCALKNRLGIDEYSVASFNWRNKNNPSFLLAKFTPSTYAVSKCEMPVQTTNLAIYLSGLLVSTSAVIYQIYEMKIKSITKFRKE